MASNGDKAQVPPALPADDAGKLLRALQRAESELAAANAALERKTQELTRALAAQVQEQEEARDFVEPDGARTRHWALLGVAAACAVVIGGLWAGRAVMGE